MSHISTSIAPATPTAATELLAQYSRVRKFTEQLVEPLEPEDCVIQSMPDVSPTRWHLAHTTWFFETFVLARALPDWKPIDPHYAFLFNSYYNGVGRQFPRAQRGLLSRPTMREIADYRRQVDDAVQRLVADQSGLLGAELLTALETGIHHEQQHQELMLTDIKHVLSCNPLYPEYRQRPAEDSSHDAPPLRWQAFTDGVRAIGHSGSGFAYDNESPRHRVFQEPFELADRLVTVGEYLEFMEDGGYRQPQWWLSLGWQTVCEQGWQAPLYWMQDDGRWQQFTLAGVRELSLDEPVCHVSYFEADAYARWRQCRLPTEAEWEVAAGELPVEGNFAESGRVHPAAAEIADSSHSQPLQMFGDVWEWTSSSYSPYPGYRPPEGALGEYNGKFMCNQYVLRGGSTATSASHMRSTYRNFFPPEARWQFSGIRLAR